MQLMLLLGGSLLYMVASSIILYTGLPPSQVGEPCLFSTWSVVPNHIVAIIQQCINKQLRGNYYTNKTVHSF